MDFGEPIAKGNTANIYLYEGKIFKVFKDFLPDTIAEYEASKQRYAYSQGLSVPWVYDVKKINGKQVIVMENVLGKTVGSMIEENTANVGYYMALSVELQIKIHKIKADDFTLMSDKLSQQLQAASYLSINQKNTLMRELSSLPSRKMLCHGDYHVFNLILNDDEMTIIDWADSSAGDISADVCRSYLLYSQFSIELAKLYLNLYCEKSGLGKEKILAWEPIIAGARLSENISSEEAKRLQDIVNRYCPN